MKKVILYSIIMIALLSNIYGENKRDTYLSISVVLDTLILDDSSEIIECNKICNNQISLDDSSKYYLDILLPITNHTQHVLTLNSVKFSNMSINSHLNMFDGLAPNNNGYLRFRYYINNLNKKIMLINRFGFLNFINENKSKVTKKISINIKLTNE